MPNPSWVFFYVASCIFSLQPYNVISYLWVSLMSVSSVQSLSHVRLFATPWIAACQESLSITGCRSLLKLMPIESVMPSSHLILCRPLLLLPPIPPSIQGLFQRVNSSHEVAKVLQYCCEIWNWVFKQLAQGYRAGEVHHQLLDPGNLTSGNVVLPRNY